MKNRVYKLVILIFIIFAFDGCGPSEETKWGIDHEAQKQVPVCDGDKVTTTNSMKVYAKEKITQLNSGTVLRIWHYQNGDKLVCVVAGKAVVDYEK